MKISFFRGLRGPRIVDQPPLNYGSDDDNTLNHGSVDNLLTSARFDCQSCCSSMSLYSYDTERDAAAFIREASGRRYNNRNELYMLPSDQPEFLRQ